MKIGTIWLISVLLLIISLTLFIWHGNTVEKEIQIVECYDDDRNKIVGLECEQERFVNPQDNYIMSILAIIFGVSLLLSGLGIIAIIMGDFHTEF